MCINVSVCKLSNQPIFHCSIFVFSKMIEFKCFDCEKEFTTAKLIAAHLKQINYADYKSPCQSEFFTFNGLRKHLKKCLKARKSSSPKYVTFEIGGGRQEGEHDPADSDIANIVESLDNNLSIHQVNIQIHTIPNCMLVDKFAFYQLFRRLMMRNQSKKDRNIITYWKPKCQPKTKGNFPRSATFFISQHPIRHTLMRIKWKGF